MKIIFAPSISLEKASTIPVKDDTKLVLNSCEIHDTQFEVLNSEDGPCLFNIFQCSRVSEFLFLSP